MRILYVNTEEIDQVLLEWPALGPGISDVFWPVYHHVPSSRGQVGLDLTNTCF